MPKLTGQISSNLLHWTTILCLVSRRRTCHPLNLRFPFLFRWKNVIWQFQACCTYNFRYFMIFNKFDSKQRMAWQEKTSEDVIKYHCYFNLTLQRTIVKLGFCTKSSYHVLLTIIFIPRFDKRIKITWHTQSKNTEFIWNHMYCCIIFSTWNLYLDSKIIVILGNLLHLRLPHGICLVWMNLSISC
jgi:hypothetical protein